jgi:hypothetical protein
MNEARLFEMGYTKYTGGRIHHNCDQYYEKSLKDSIGKKYQVVFYMYDWKKYPQFNGREPIGYMPEIYYQIDEDVAVYHKFAGFKDSIDYVEMYAEKMWEALGKPYLERWEK